MKIVIAAAAVLSLSNLNTFATSQDDAFQKIAHDYVEQYLQTNPEQATELGDHRFDGKLTDYSAEARAKDLATQKEFRGKLNAIDGSQLAGANNIDFRILKENIDYEIFRAEELKEADGIRRGCQVGDQHRPVIHRQPAGFGTCGVVDVRCKI